MSKNNQTEINSSQTLIPINEIRDDCVVLKNGTILSVIKVNGVNIDLLPEENMASLNEEWQGFLNNLDFSLEVCLSSDRADLANYLKVVYDKTVQEKNPLLKEHLNNYYSFISDFVKKYPLMKKQFYVVVPYEGGELTVKQASGKIGEMFKKFFNFKRQAFDATFVVDDEVFARNHSQLLVRQRNVVGFLQQMGLGCKVLNNEELIYLYYDKYNPHSDNILNA